ncbi:alkaline phosphatase [Niabella drilacis]|uniref:Type I phosphodiesterase / nucleotide pyrophosphatase n=1 Tax=Niabella drilacis (strain DSM 25811 / CCM 8410 / CCUG 62505 / LMG 26954 / E90) TaxID=1285928 RepID=A0A1G6NCG0_NIADE|nr:alkaline phosphatase [Niabella drilacis]SDC64986.1 Type I phosphodiesterase / nucleotide pyrophosphatase [Niabella drilacis]
MDRIRKTIIALMLLWLPFAVTAQPSKVKHVILIGCDGFGAYALPQAEMPQLKRLMQEGAWSLTARSVLPSSSAVNWASLLMGAGPTVHGYTEWNSAVPEIPSADTSRFGLFPSVFSLLKEQRPEAVSALIYSWQGIGPLLEKAATTIRVAGKDNDDFCVDTAVAIIKSVKPVLTFVHLDEPDGVGHNIGHRTPEYYKELQKVDARIGRIVKAVEDAGIANESVILVTADHGGKGKGHGGKSLDEVQIPWVVYGRGVQKGRALTQPVITYDTAATIAWLLRLKMPESWRGMPVKEAFR